MLQVLTSDYAYCLIDLIRSTRASIDILSYIFNANLYKRYDKANLIFLELKKFARSQGYVRFILDYPKLYKPNYHPTKFFTRRFKESGFDVRYLRSSQTQHAKVLIFDSRLVVTGSHNITSRSVVSRHELSLLLDDHALLTTLCEYFESIWSISIEA